MKFTKIVATLGPATDSVPMIRKLRDAGMDVARLNFSHGNHEYHKKVIHNIKKVDRNIAILLDTAGPEVRTGDVAEGGLDIKTGQKLMITNMPCVSEGKKLTIDYPKLMHLKKGARILIDDGLIEAEVIKQTKNGLSTIVRNGGRLQANKSVSLPGHKIELPFLSEKDKKDIKFGKDYADFIAASFVRNAKDVEEMRNFAKSDAMIISKIEHWEAVDHIEEIIEASDGIMIARGDLGVEISLEKVPKIQKDTIRRCNELGKPVIVATQMLESMKNNPRPTRAEVSDVAHAIMQGTDAIMLSAETTIGEYPEEAVQMMTRIAKEYDKQVDVKIKHKQGNSVAVFVTEAAFLAAKKLGISAILIPTQSGFTARNVSRFKPHIPIMAMAPNSRIFRQLRLSWGVVPVCIADVHVRFDTMIRQLVEECLKLRLVKISDKIVITGGYKLGEIGGTNVLEINKVKDILKRKNN